jgi:hypothetical protein
VRPTGTAGVRLGRAGRGWALAFGVGLLAPGLAASGADPTPSAKVIYHNSRAFRIPFNIEPEERARIKEVLLCVSEDRGQTWKPVVSRTTPDKRALAYRAPQDGEYWFAVQTLDTEGKLYPPTNSAIEPKMKVIVDTVPPTILLAANGRRGSLASVRWEVRDDKAIDLHSFVLEFQAVGASDWRQVPVRAPVDPAGKATWDAGTAGPVRVRAQVADRAQNVHDMMVVLPDGTPENPAIGRAGPIAGPAEPSPVGTFASAEVDGLPQIPSGGSAPRPAPVPAGPAPAASNPFDVPTRADVVPETAPDAGGKPQLIPSPKFNLQYEVADAGPGGPATVELWVTQNGGRTWSPLAQDSDRKPPFPVALGGEGVFGLKLVARSASKLGDSPPEPGEAPDYLVEVDSTPPVVKLDRVQVGVGPDAGKIALTWHASDLHLGPRPVTISVRPEGAAEWRPIGPPVENSSRYVWTLPPTAPQRFYVRVQVADSVGNVGTDETPEGSPLNIDRTRPKGRITRIEPIGPGVSQ